MATRLFIAMTLGLAQAPAVALDDTSGALRTLTVDGVEREWQILVPDSYRDGERVPLVLEFHGTGATPESQTELSGFPALAKEQGFLLVAPVARYQRVQDQRLTWNVDLHDDAVDDVAFIDALLDRVSAQYAVDPARIYAVGFSGGARMSSRLACDLSDRIAAISAVAGLRFPEDCQPSRPVPVIAFHGRKDVINHYEHQPNSPDYWRMGVEDALTGWIGNNGCNARPKVERLGNNDARLAYVDCRQGANVTFYRSELANHTWPGTPLADGIRERWGPETVSDVPATTLTWAFFASHPMPAAD